MAHVIDRMRRIAHFMNRINNRMKAIEHSLISLEQKLGDNESPGRANIHSMQVAEALRVETESNRREGLNDDDLDLDLTKQFGTSSWARRLISETIEQRTRRRAH